MFTLLQTGAIEDTVTGLGHAWEKLGIVGVMGVFLGVALLAVWKLWIKYTAYVSKVETMLRERNHADRESRYVPPPTRPDPPDVAGDHEAGNAGG